MGWQLGRRMRVRGRSQAGTASMPLMPSLARRRLQCYLALMLSDIVALFASFAITGFVYLDRYGLTISPSRSTMAPIR
jgi:hypothetical protein